MLWNPYHILIRIGDSCDVGCSGCYQFKSAQIFYDFKTVKNNIKRYRNIFEGNSVFTIVWWNPLLFKDIVQLLEFILKEWVKKIIFPISFFNKNDFSFFKENKKLFSDPRINLGFYTNLETFVSINPEILFSFLYFIKKMKYFSRCTTLLF